MLSCPLCPVVISLVISGDDCCSVVLGTLVGVLSVMWSKLLMTCYLMFSVVINVQVPEWSVRSHLR